MVEGTVTHPTGNIRLIIQEHLISKIQQGCTYMFKKIKIKKNKEIYVDTAYRHSEIIPTLHFMEMFHIAHEMPMSTLIPLLLKQSSELKDRTTTCYATRQFLNKYLKLSFNVTCMLS